MKGLENHDLKEYRENTGEIVVYQPDEITRLEVMMTNETVWLTQAQISQLFGVGQPAISKHLKNIFSSGELEITAVHSILEYTAGVEAVIYTGKISKQLRLDIDKHNAQYPPVEVRTFEKAHDRFLIIDDAVYLVGVSIKDLGKKWFGFTLMENTDAEELMGRI